MAKAGRGDDQYMVRFPEGLRDRIKDAAEKNGRSMNSEIIAALEEAFPPHMSVGEFVEVWLGPFAKATDDQSRSEIVEQANQAAEAGGCNFRARSDGSSFIVYFIEPGLENVTLKASGG